LIARNFLIIAFVSITLISSCSTTQLKSQAVSKSNPSLCYSMIYQKDSISNEYFAIMLKEALSRNLNCKDIPKEIIDFKKKLTGSDNSGSSGQSNEASSNDHSNEGVNWVTGQGRST
jgi:hypothetical protein